MEMKSDEELKEVTDLSKNHQKLSQIVSNIFNTQLGYQRKRTLIEAFQDLQELKKALDESLDLTGKIFDPRISALVTTHQKYVQQINPMIEDIIYNRSKGNLNWGRTRFARELPKEVLITLIPENMKMILAVLRLPKQSEPFILSLEFARGEEDDLINELVGIENTSVLSRKRGGWIMGGSEGPISCFVTIVTLISVAANIAKISETILKYLKKGEKKSSKSQVTIKTPTGEVSLSNLSSSEIDKILESLKEMMNKEKQREPMGNGTLN